MPHADPFTRYSSQRTGQERQVLHNKARAESMRAAETVGEWEDPRMNAAQRQLGLMLADYRERNPVLNVQTARDMQDMVRDFRESAKRKGVVFPKLRLVYFVRMNHVCVWPQDMEHAELQKRVRMFVVHRQRHGRSVDAEDIAMGVRRAYPDYSPSRHSLILPPSLNNQQEISQ